MDILKACATNVWRIDNLALIDLKWYTSSHSANVHETDILGTLRRRGILCIVDEGHLLVFEQEQVKSLEAIQTLKDEWHLVDHSSLKDYVLKHDNDRVLDKLGPAIEAAISPKLLQDHSIHRLGKGTWIHRADGLEHEDALLIQLHMQLSASDSIFLAVTARPLIEPQVLGMPAGVSDAVCLVPSGSIAQRVDSPRDSAVSGQIYDLEDSPNSAWKIAVGKNLSTQGVEVAADSSWAQLHLLGEQTSFWWPASLCVPLSTARGKHHEFQDPKHIDTVGGDHQLNTEDVLSFAESWILSADERKRELELLKYPQALPDEIVDVSPQARFDIATATSPPYLYRPDLVNTLSIYPTPPDGMATTVTQASITAEASGSFAPVAEHNPIAPTLYRTATNDDDVLLEPRERGPSIASSVGVSYHRNVDDLFGEGDAELGTAEVDDNDFDFFDDQDDVEMQDIEAPAADLAPSSPSTGDAASATRQHEDSSMIFAPGHALSDPTVSHETQVSTTLDMSLASAVPEGSSAVLPHIASPSDIYKPLSPFDIRERLLPPPIPASVANQTKLNPALRRTSTFDPLTFNTDHGFLSKQSAGKHTCREPQSTNHFAQAMDRHHPAEDPDTELSDSSSSASSFGKPPLLPWQNQKRGRTAFVKHDSQGTWDITSYAGPSDDISLDSTDLLVKILTGRPDLAESTQQQKASISEHHMLGSGRPQSHYSEDDVIAIAQLLTYQSITCTDMMLREVWPKTDGTTVQSGQVPALTADVVEALSAVLPAIKACDMQTLALVKETLRPSVTQVKGQPRPQVRPETSHGPDVQMLPAPYLRLRRADTALEMLPPAVSFWEELGLQPYTGTKDIAAYCIAPRSIVNGGPVSSFWESFTAAYEGCKLGAVNAGELVSHGNAEDQVKHLRVIDGPVRHITESQHQVCMDLCNDIANTDLQTGNAVVFMVDCSPDASFRPNLCAIFQEMLKRYDERKPTSIGCKLILQILPATLFTEDSLLHTTHARMMASLAREVFDRCCLDCDKDLLSPLPIGCSPAVLLAEPRPRRINLQLVATPPSNLLHENSELHIAYTRSKDRMWLIVSWLDITGSAQATSSFCLQGVDFSTVALEVMNRTASMLRAREVSWRVTLASDEDISDIEANSWRDAVTALSHLRKGTFTVFLVTINNDPVLALSAIASLEAASITTNPAGGVLTPVTTPQGSSITFSPDASGQATPATPVPTDSIAENDSDAHLVDLPDESWRVLLNTDVPLMLRHNTSGQAKPVAQGILVKHGEAVEGIRHKLPLSAVSLVWMVRVRAGGGSIEDATQRQAEMMLREILTAYRNLAVLAKLRGLCKPGEECLPLHMICARRGAGMLHLM